jgi:hypothetical protein
MDNRLSSPQTPTMLPVDLLAKHKRRPEGQRLCVR